MPSQNYYPYIYHCPDGHDYEIRIDENGDAFVKWAGKEFNAIGFDYFSEYKYQKEYEKFLKRIIIQQKYFYEKEYAIKKLGGKCYICGTKDDLKICNLKIYQQEDKRFLSGYEKIKTILNGKTNNYILLCPKCMDNRKKIIIRLINYYEENKKKINGSFVIPDSIKKYMKKLKVPFDVVKKSFPYDNIELKE